MYTTKILPHRKKGAKITTVSKIGTQMEIYLFCDTGTAIVMMRGTP